MSRLYLPIWEAVKASANLTAEVVVVKDRVPTVIQGVRKIKAEENVHRSGVGLIPWSRLQSRVEMLDEKKGLVKIVFWLYYDTRL